MVSLPFSQHELLAADVHNVGAIAIAVLMQFRTATKSAMLAIAKHGVCVGIIAPCFGQFHNGRHRVGPQ